MRAFASGGAASRMAGSALGEAGVCEIILAGGTMGVSDVGHRQFTSALTLIDLIDRRMSVMAMHYERAAW